LTWASLSLPPSSFFSRGHGAQLRPPHEQSRPDIVGGKDSGQLPVSGLTPQALTMSPHFVSSDCI